MPKKTDLIAAGFGIWRLMRFDDDGMKWFDFSIAGFWRSFFAALVAAPLFALLITLSMQRHGETAEESGGIIEIIAIYAFGWAIVPIIMILVTKLLGLKRGFIPMMVTYNWATVPQMMIQLLAVLPGSLGLISEELSTLILFVAVVYILVFEWFVVRTALQTTTSTAIGIVLLLEIVNALVKVSH